MSPTELVHLETEGPIGVVTLNRAEALNAISGALADKLTGAFTDVGSRTDIWVVVLRAEGERAFCVGADLKERATFSPADFRTNRERMRRMFQALRSIPQPTIAAVFGHTLGGGFELALSCDLIVAAEDAEFGLPEARVGLLPAGGGTQLLPRVVGMTRAKEMIFTGRRIDAAEAEQHGIAVDVVAREFLDEEAKRLAGAICRSSPVAVREAKMSLRTALGSELEDGIEHEHSSWERVIASVDRVEGIDAFNDKRDPMWRNR